MAKFRIVEAEALHEISNALSKFDELDKARSAVLTRAENAALATIPDAFPSKDYKEGDELETVYNGTGPRAVLNLSSELGTTLFPANGEAFYRLQASQETDKQLNGASEGAKTQALLLFSKIERAMDNSFLEMKSRPVLIEGLIQLVVTGNVLYMIFENRIVMYGLRDYVVQRTKKGDILQLILREDIDPLSLDEKVLAQLEIETDTEETLVKYSRFHVSGDNWIYYEEINGEIIDGSIKKVRDDSVPFIPVRWTKKSGENYGKGPVNDMLSDFQVVNGLTKRKLEYASIVSKVLYGVPRSSGLSPKKIEDALNGAFLRGDLSKITTLSVDKIIDMNFVSAVEEQAMRRIAQTFLLGTDAVRDSDRTTAQEIKILIKELNSAFANIFSILDADLQTPLAAYLLKQAEDKINIDLENGVVPVSRTGTESLSRSNDLQNLVTYLDQIQKLGAGQRINVDEVSKRLALYTGIRDSEELLLSEEQKQQVMAGDAQANQTTPQQQ